jgi:hypothetical protein
MSGALPQLAVASSSQQCHHRQFQGYVELHCLCHALQAAVVLGFLSRSQRICGQYCCCCCCCWVHAAVACLFQDVCVRFF